MGKSDPQDLLRLADELEKATGPDRRLDALIAVAFELATGIHPTKPERCAWHDGMGLFTASPEYTASLDAAMTLVPGNICPGVSMNVHHGDWHAWMGKLVNGEPDDIASANAATPALALCAAALKARAHSTKETSNG